MNDVHIQPLPLDPQWFPQTWDVTVTAGGKTITLDSAQPAYRAAALPSGGIDVEAVYGGLGSAADLVGKDLKGKAVFTYTMLGMHNEGAVRRADDRGAAAIFEVDMLPGNMRSQAYPSNTKATVSRRSSRITISATGRRSSSLRPARSAMMKCARGGFAHQWRRSDTCARAASQ